MKKILVLAGGIDQIGLIQELKQRGYYVVLVDYYENPVAKPYADKHIQASTLDIDAVLNIAKDEGVENIITTCTDQALLTVAYVAEKMNFKKQFSFEQVRNITNKLYMKKIMIDNNIPTAKYVNTSTLDSGIGDLKFPLMVKPADCNSSKGVRRVDNQCELETAFKYATKVSRTGGVIIEEFIDGMEVSVDAFICNGDVNLLMCSEIRKLKLDRKNSIIYQSRIPAPITENIEYKIKDILRGIANAFDINNSPLLVQLLVNDENVYVIEFSARIGGGQKYITIKEKTGFDILSENINCILGEPVRFYKKESPYFFSRTHIYVHPGIFDKITNYESLLADNTIMELNITKSSGASIDSIGSSGDRVGNFLVKASNTTELDYKINKALSTIKVLDKNNKDILYRELYS